MPKQTRHSPGPWRWYWRYRDGENDGGIVSEPHTGHGYSVARCPRYQMKAQWRVDAALIAAAPDLLEALEAFRDAKAFLGADDFDDGPEVRSKFEHADELARAAIEKAKP